MSVWIELDMIKLTAMSYYICISLFISGVCALYWKITDADVVSIMKQEEGK